LVHEIYNNFASLLEATNKVKQVRESNWIEGWQKDWFYNAIIKNEILENDIAEKIWKNILNPEKLRTALWIEELIKKLVEEKKSPAEISKILKQITEQVTNYLEELNKQLEESTDATGFDDELTQIDKNDGKRRLNSPAIQDKFIKKVNKYLEENKKEAPISDKEKEQLIAEFLEENTRWLDINPEPLKDKQRKNFRSIIENNWSIIQVNFYHDNTKVITEWVLAWKSIPEIQRELAEKWVNIYETSTERKERLEKEAKLQTEQKDTQAETQTSQAFSLTSEWNINIKWEKEPIKLNEDEKKLIKLSEKNIENIGNFYKTLKTVWLSQLWPHRQEIFKWIQNKRPNEFKSNDFDYLNENETKIFLNSILKSTWRNEVWLNQNLEQFKEKVRNQNSENLLWKVEQVTVFYWWRTSIEQDFLHKFFPVWSPIFKFNEFMNSI
jgi:hypothetical protein